MRKQQIEYGNGSIRFAGQLIFDDTLGGLRPGALVFPEAFGLNDHAIQRAERLAQLGYVALAADVHGDATRFPDLPSAIPVIKGYYADRADWRSRARAAFDTLLAQANVDRERIAAIGFCFGGATCFELARSGAALSAIATFHAGLVPELDGDAGSIRAKVLICHGADDPLVNKESLDKVIGELRRDRVDWQQVSYGNTVHSFTDPAADERNVPALRYNAQADTRSWQAMLRLFEEACR